MFQMVYMDTIVIPVTFTTVFGLLGGIDLITSVKVSNYTSDGRQHGES